MNGTFVPIKRAYLGNVKGDLLVHLYQGTFVPIKHPFGTFVPINGTFVPIMRYICTN